MTNSRRKGKEYELEVAKQLREHGLNARRGQQYSGANGDPDVICEEWPDLHLELKRRERNISAFEQYKFMDQAVNDAKDGQMPVVVYRIDYEQSLVTMRLDDFIELAKKGASK